MRNGVVSGWWTRMGLHYVVCGSYNARSRDFRGYLGGTGCIFDFMVIFGNFDHC